MRSSQDMALKDAFVWDELDRMEESLIEGANPNLIYNENEEGAMANLSEYREFHYYEMMDEERFKYGSWSGNSLLIQAAHEGRAEIVALLLEYGANINQRNIFGLTALMAAALRGHLEVIKVLLEYTPDMTLVLHEENPKTASELAFSNRQYEACLLIAEQELTPKFQYAIIAYLYGNTTIFNKIGQTSADLYGHIEVEPQDWLRTALFTAVGLSDYNAVKILTEVYKEPNIWGHDPVTHAEIRLLAWAVQKNNLEIVKLLVGKGAWIDQPVTRDWTRLPALARMNILDYMNAKKIVNDDIRRYLVEQGAVPSVDPQQGTKMGCFVLLKNMMGMKPSQNQVAPAKQATNKI